MKTRTCVPFICTTVVAPTALALLLATSGALAQSVSFTVTNVAVSGADTLTVRGLNVGGQLAGSYYTGSTPHAFVWENGIVVDLGTLGGSSSEALAINSFGHVAGDAATVGDGAVHAFFGIGRTLFDLGTLGGRNSVANSISDAGHVAGSSDTSGVDFRAFLQLPNGGTMVDLGTLGGSISSATAVNNAGQVAGDSLMAGDGEQHAFLYSGTLRDLGTLGGTFSRAWALNEAGWVVGEATLAGDVESHGFLFDGSVRRDLGTLGGTFSAAYSLNNAGDIVGDSSLTGDTTVHAFLYRSGVMQDLGTLGGSRSSVTHINNAGQIIGSSEDASGTRRAFLWQAGVMSDLNTLLPPNSGWLLTDAYFLNDNGQIVGVGSYQGVVSWYVLTPRSNQNQSPVANAGPDQNVSCPDTAAPVTLNGSGSSDPDGDALTFEWFEGGVVVAQGESPTLSLALGVHNIALRVTDPSGAYNDDAVVVNLLDTGAPVFNCPADRTAPAGENGRALVPDFLAGLVVSDNGTAPADLQKAQNPVAGTSVPCGVHTVVITVTDAAGNASACNSVHFTVVDVTAPAVQAPAVVTLDNCQATVPNLSSVVTASDNCTPAELLSLTQQPEAGTPLVGGRQEVLVTVTDQAGNATSVIVVVEASDHTPPVVNSVKANPSVLTQVNRKMVPVKICVVATDSCDPAPRSRITSVTSTDPVTGHSDTTAPDWDITGDLTLEVRAEVSSSQDPRIYTIRVDTTDASGNTTCSKTTVQVLR